MFTESLPKLCSQVRVVESDVKDHVNRARRATLLLGRAIALQFGEILLDAATLQVMLLAISVSVAPTAVFGSFAMASAVSRLVPVPLGLGTFEAALVTMLHVVGVPLEAALTATLLLRGFTLCLPMLPGLWFARRELWTH